jgi:hypothetical protein
VCGGKYCITAGICPSTSLFQTIHYSKMNLYSPTTACEACSKLDQEILKKIYFIIEASAIPGTLLNSEQASLHFPLVHKGLERGYGQRILNVPS